MWSGILRRLCRSKETGPDWRAGGGIPTIRTPGDNVRTERSGSHKHQGTGRRGRDYGVPNSSWNTEMVRLYESYSARTALGHWKRLPSYNRHGVTESSPESPNRLMTRNSDVEGSAFEYAMFLNASERRIVGIFQPGPLLEGHASYTHGGAIVALLDGVAGTCAAVICGPVMTANVNINFKRPVPLGSTVVMEIWIDKVDKRKIFLSCRVTNSDGSELHTEGTFLFIKLLDGNPAIGK
ncbi:acyl-coenzyme A thioesterase THEM4-like isoform X3 [Mustelus asterias]